MGGGAPQRTLRSTARAIGVTDPRPSAPGLLVVLVPRHQRRTGNEVGSARGVAAPGAIVAESAHVRKGVPATVLIEGGPRRVTTAAPLGLPAAPPRTYRGGGSLVGIAVPLRAAPAQALGGERRDRRLEPAARMLEERRWTPCGTCCIKLLASSTSSQIRLHLRTLQFRASSPGKRRPRRPLCSLPRDHPLPALLSRGRSTSG